MVHHRIVDTSVLFPHRAGAPYRRALRDMCVARSARRRGCTDDICARQRERQAAEDDSVGRRRDGPLVRRRCRRNAESCPLVGRERETKAGDPREASERPPSVRRKDYFRGLSHTKLAAFICPASQHDWSRPQMSLIKPSIINRGIHFRFVCPKPFILSLHSGF